MTETDSEIMQPSVTMLTSVTCSLVLLNWYDYQCPIDDFVTSRIDNECSA